VTESLNFAGAGTEILGGLTPIRLAADTLAPAARNSRRFTGSPEYSQVATLPFAHHPLCYGVPANVRDGPQAVKQSK